MLVLTRKVNQQIRLGNDITITVIRVQGNSIRIGVDAPRDVRVLRGELEPRDAVATETATVEFDLQDLLDEPVVEPVHSGRRQTVEPQVYQMRTAAPLAGFVRNSAETMAGSLSLQ